MLPSGNDAAQTICENIGKHLAHPSKIHLAVCPDGLGTKQQPTSNSGYQSYSLASILQVYSSLKKERLSAGRGSTGNSSAQTADTEPNQTSSAGQSSIASSTRPSNEVQRKNRDSVTKHFIDRMNKLAQELNMQSSSFCNPHGLMNKYNHSSSKDLAMLLDKGAKEHPEFCRIIATQSHTVRLHRDGEECEVEWKNTHKCFDDPRFLGGKTGITVAAGPCLASRFRLSNGRIINIILLNSKDVQARVIETKKLCDWVERHYDILTQLDLNYP